MKRIASVVFSFVLTSILAISMNAYATVWLEAETDQSSYNVGDPVNITANWTVFGYTPTFSATYTIVYMNVTDAWTNLPQSNHTGWWNTGGSGGEITLSCNQDVGDAYYVWDSTGFPAHPYYVDVEVHTWDNNTMPARYDWARVSTRTFELN